MADSKTKFRVGLVQMRTGKNVEENLKQAESFIRKAAGLGANYVQTPENTLVMEVDAQHLLEKISPEDETAGVAHFSHLAKELGIWLHIGSIAVKVGEQLAANRAFLFAPDGKAVCRYDKIHMFDVDLPSGETYRESATFAPGGFTYVAELPWGGLGIATCYDIRFPEQYKALARAGAKFLTAPSAFTKVTGEKHWHVLLRARAIENGCFMFAAAQGGTARERPHHLWPQHRNLALGRDPGRGRHRAWRYRRRYRCGRGGPGAGTHSRPCSHARVQGGDRAAPVIGPCREQ